MRLPGLVDLGGFFFRRDRLHLLRLVRLFGCSGMPGISERFLQERSEGSGHRLFRFLLGFGFLVRRGLGRGGDGHLRGRIFGEQSSSKVVTLTTPVFDRCGAVPLGHACGIGHVPLTEDA